MAIMDANSIDTMVDTVASFDDPDMETASVHSTSTTLSDLLDIDVDPKLLFGSITSLLSTLEETVVVLGALRWYSSQSLLGDLSTVCHDLFKQICELEQLVSSYLHVWNPNNPDNKVVLDPMLYKWVADCMICLLGLHAHLREELGQYEISKTPIRASLAETTTTKVDEADVNSLSETLSCFPDLNAVTTWETYLTKIQNYATHLQAALPVMQADLGTYQTSNLQFPGDVISYSSLPSNIRKSSSSSKEPQRLSTGIPLLRRTLYTLKDALSELDVSVQDCIVECILPESSATMLHSLRTSVSSTMNALSTCLTNHGSDWLDSLLAGGMSFSQFRALDQEHLQTVCLVLGEWSQSIRIRAISSRYSFNSNGEVVRREFLLTEDDLSLPKGLLEELNRSLKAEFSRQ